MNMKAMVLTCGLWLAFVGSAGTVFYVDAAHENPDADGSSERPFADVFIARDAETPFGIAGFTMCRTMPFSTVETTF